MKYRIAINRMATGKLPKGDPRWHEFTNSFVNRELELLEIANAIYTGHAYCPWQRSVGRSSENFLCAQHIAIDMDTKDDRSTIAALSQHPFVRMYGALIHTSPSHTEAEPRARAIFFLDRAIESALGYTAAVSFMMAQFDDPDPVCKDPSRFFYGAHGCDIWFQEGELPIAHLRHYYKQWERTRPKSSAPPAKADGKIINLQQKREEKRTDTETKDELERVGNALRKIDPWSIDYNRWIGILAALKREFGDRALSLAEEWAQGQDGEVRREWEKHLKPNRGGKQTTLGTIYHLAGGM